MAKQAVTRRPAPTPTHTEVPDRLWSLALVASTTLLLVQVLRVLFPLAYNLGERSSFTSAGIFALALSLTPLVAPLLIRSLGVRTALIASVSGLALGRLAIQLVHPVPLWLASVAVVFGLLALTTVVVGVPRSGRLAGGIVFGLAIDSAIRGAYWTWDYAWQDGVIAVLLTAAAGGLAAIAAVRIRLEEERRPTGWGLVALGPFLFLQLLFLQSPAFVASSADLSLPVANAVVLAGNALGLWYLSLADRPSQPTSWLSGLVLVAAGGLLPRIEFGLPLVVVIGQGMAVPLLARGLAPTRMGQAGWRSASAVGLGSFVFILLTLLYYLHYDSPLPFSNSLLPLVAAVVVASGALRAATVEAQPTYRLGLVSLALLAFPAAMAGWGSALAPAGGADGTFRLVDYNVHNGVSPTGQLNPEAIALVIEAEQPDVVVLNEVNRGWAIAGGIDLAEWLSQRLDMEYVYSPAADGQFGNAVMSRSPITSVERVTLPKAGGPMLRNATLATLDLGNGRVVDVIAVHLDHRDEGRETRLTQIDILLDAWDQRPVTVIAGDMNARPESDEIATLLASGLVSAQDEAGDPILETYPASDPDRRIDYVFGSDGITFSNFRIPRSTASDHLPLSVTVRVG